MTNNLDRVYDLDSPEVVSTLDEAPFWSAPFGIKLLNYIRLKHNITALDIGFGTGFPLTELALRLGNTAKIYGIDPWEAALKRAKKKVSVYELTNVELILGVAENIPLDADTIDLIISNNGINNVSDLNKVIEECARVIKPDGQFVQTINLESTMTEFYQVLEEVLTENKLVEYVPGINQHIYEKRKPLDEFTTLLEDKGFKIEQIINDYFSYKFVDGTTLLNHYFIRLAFLPSWKKLVPENKVHEIFNQIEQKLNSQAKSKGYIELSVPFVVIDCIKK